MGAIQPVRESLRDGEHYAGIILGKDGQPDHHLVLLPGDAADVSWSAASEWATRSGGELPNRRELALLFANLKEEFERAWYWSCEPYESRHHLVWGQNFTSGIQTIYGRPFRAHARAIRRIAA